MNPGRRIVLGTGVLVSAALRPGSILDRAFSRALRDCVICACEPTLEELRMVLNRSKFARYLSRPARDEFLRFLRHSVWICPLSPSDVAAVKPSCRDRRDKVFLALALAAEAELIVSSDQNLLVCHPWRGIAIRTPADFLSE